MTAWVGEYDSQSDKLFAPDDRYLPEDGVVDAAVVRSGSRLPVWDVVVIFTLPDGTHAPSVHPRTIRVLPPQDERATPKPQQYSTASQVGVVIQFRDATNAVWQRDRFGLLTEVIA